MVRPRDILEYNLASFRYLLLWNDSPLNSHWKETLLSMQKLVLNIQDDI